MCAKCYLIQIIGKYSKLCQLLCDQERVDLRHILKNEAKCIEHLCTNRHLRKGVVGSRELMVLSQSVSDLTGETCTCTKYHSGKHNFFSE